MKRLLVLVGVAAAVLGALAFVLVPGPGVGFVEARIQQALGRPVEFTNTRWVWPAGLDADRITLKGTGGFSRADVLVARGLSVRLRPAALASGTVVASSVTVDDLLVRVHYDDGSITHPLSTPEAEPSPIANWTDHVRNLRIENGTVEFYDHDTRLFLDGDELRRRFEASVQELAVDVQTDESGTVQYGATGVLDLGASHPNGQVAFLATTEPGGGTTVSRLQVDGVALPAFNAYLRRAMTRFADGRLSLQSNTRAVNGLWMTSATVDMADLGLAPIGTSGAPAPGPNPSSLLALVADPSGTTSLDVDFTWNRNSSQTFQQALGEGLQAAVRERMVAGIPNMLGGLIGGLIQGATGAGNPSGNGASPLQGLLEGLQSGSQ